jgi:hypothetical protein
MEQLRALTVRGLIPKVQHFSGDGLPSPHYLSEAPHDAFLPGPGHTFSAFLEEKCQRSSRRVRCARIPCIVETSLEEENAADDKACPPLSCFAVKCCDVFLISREPRIYHVHNTVHVSERGCMVVRKSAVVNLVVEVSVFVAPLTEVEDHDIVATVALV